MSLKGKVIFITGSSRGIGKAIALRTAREGAKIVVIGKTDQPHPKLTGTVHSTVEEIRELGGEAFAAICDIRYEDQIEAAVHTAIDNFSGIDILINNASAISLTSTPETSMKKFDLMMNINIRGTFFCSQKCLPFLKKASNPHILTLSPPLSIDPKWFQNHVAYTISKYGMSMCVLGMAAEFQPFGIAVNALWPRTIIATAAVENLLGGDKSLQHSRKPEIVAEAAAIILNKPSRETTGKFFIDDEVLMAHGICNLDQYSMVPNADLYPDLFLAGDPEYLCEDEEK